MLIGNSYVLRLFIIIISLAAIECYGQEAAPVNIGFERGDFFNWNTYIGEVSPTNSIFAPRPPTVTLRPSQPVSGALNSQLGRHTLITDSGQNDPYGGFPLKAPNGSKYIVRLGSAVGNKSAEKMTYSIKVPDNARNNFILLSYAVVLDNVTLQDLDEQPKFTIRARDGQGNLIECAFSEWIAEQSIPGFNTVNGFQIRSWSPVLVDLSKYPGQTISFEFITVDSSVTSHDDSSFAYAYLDFVEAYDFPITGNLVCASTGSISLKTIPGFHKYRWYNTSNMKTLGTDETLTLSPVPDIGTTIGVELIPEPGFGCTQTLYTTIQGPELKINDPIPACQPINLTEASITTGSSGGLTYSYWLDAAAIKEIPDPDQVSIAGTYYVKAASASGCFVTKPVVVSIIPPPLITISAPATVEYPLTVDISSTYIPQNGVAYSYWQDMDATIRVADPQKISSGGTFYIRALSKSGCESIEAVQVDIIVPEILIPNTFTPNGDNVNDVFKILIDDTTPVVNFTILNRWGQVVFRTRDTNKFWDGTKDGRQLPDGTYYWFLKSTVKEQNKSGAVTIIR